MKQAIIAVSVVAAVVVAAVVVYRLSVDALALIAGVVLGVLALIPTFVLAVMIMRRTNREVQEPTRPVLSQPPVVVISGGYPTPHFQQPLAAQPAAYGAPLLPAPAQPPQRQFRVMGYESADTVNLADDEWSAFG